MKKSSEAFPKHQGKIAFSDEINIRQAGAGVYASDYSGHGNQQMRVVHTSHGDYLAYTTDLYVGRGGMNLTQNGIMKVNSDGSTTLLEREFKPYGSSSLSITCDSEENVWAVVLEGNILNEASNNRPHNLFVAAYRIDAENDRVQGYNAILSTPECPNCSKTELCYDPLTNQIYVFTNSSRCGGSELWAIFDCTSRKWDRNVRYFDQGMVHFYKYLYPDEKGGVILVDNRCGDWAFMGYPECANNYGPSEEEWKTVKRWSALYSWDGLQIMCIPDIKKAEAFAYDVVKPDYSRILGDLDYRYSLEGRYSNWYPLVNNNNGGDFFRDSKKNIHLIYNYKYIQAAGYRPLTDSSVWYHEVYDVSDPRNVRRLSQKVLHEDTIDQKFYANTSWRMYESCDGELYVISGYNDGGEKSRLRVFSLTESEERPFDFEYEKVAEIEYEGGWLVTISNNRGNCYDKDKVIDVIYKSKTGKDFPNYYHDDYLFRQIKIGKFSGDV